MKVKLVRLWTAGPLHQKNVYTGVLMPDIEVRSNGDAIYVNRPRLPTVGQTFYMSRSDQDAMIRTSTVMAVNQDGNTYTFETKNSKYQLELL